MNAIEPREKLSEEYDIERFPRGRVLFDLCGRRKASSTLWMADWTWTKEEIKTKRNETENRDDDDDVDDDDDDDNARLDKAVSGTATEKEIARLANRKKSDV